MRDKAEALKKAIKLFKELVDSPHSEFDNGLKMHSRVYWFYQDVVNFMDYLSQRNAESYLDQAQDIVEHPKPGLGYDTVRYRNRLEAAVNSMITGLGGKAQIA